MDPTTILTSTTDNPTVSTIKIAYMNIRGQTGLDITKQIQIEKFLQSNKIDILNCQEINIKEDDFSQNSFVTSSYEIISNNALNKYGTCCFISSDFTAENIKMDTGGRVIKFDLENITFCNIYLPSGNSANARSSRENYLSETLPSILINSQDNGCIGGDWNCISSNLDATNNVSSKMSPSLKKLIKNFSWVDSFRSLHPQDLEYSHYYDNAVHGQGATRIDRMYHHGEIIIIKAEYVPVPFSDHFGLVITISVPECLSRLASPKSKPLFKANPDVVTDSLFQQRLREAFTGWVEIKSFDINIFFYFNIQYGTLHYGE